MKCKVLYAGTYNRYLAQKAEDMNSLERGWNMDFK